ncbi:MULTISPECIES: hypothetical protein [Acinetobacter calcoaceticus/baumannii complex]|uniref:hypothetical protein n=1 Tax=Acinetobacter calcoaceticus/baumannii complex TaxID=909768 RepID=UPI0003DF9591|nr:MULTISPECIES: hypothetical protein [Acinetobacter calcoaceticus/baumannii complex]ETR93025.1 putative membrane protein [Acinetobacter lactucae]MCG9510917.1 hypothetical protein [Acinetobacter pittii]
MIKFFKSRPFLCLFILLISAINIGLYYNYGYPSNLSIFIGVFLNLTMFLIAALLSFAYTENRREQPDKIENFLEIPSGNLKYNHIMSFLSDQVFGTFLTTLMLVYGRKIFEITESSVAFALFSFILFVATIVIFTFSFGKISLQIFRSQMSGIKQLLTVILFLVISCWIYAAGIELAPKISPSVQQNFLSK